MNRLIVQLIKFDSTLKNSQLPITLLHLEQTIPQLICQKCLHKPCQPSTTTLPPHSTHHPHYLHPSIPHSRHHWSSSLHLFDSSAMHLPKLPETRAIRYPQILTQPTTIRLAAISHFPAFLMLRFPLKKDHNHNHNHKHPVMIAKRGHFILNPDCTRYTYIFLEYFPIAFHSRP